jgi:hypothetical protein
MYSPLIDKRAVRVLDLLPGRDDADIVCNISIVYLEDRPHYKALSYI